MKEKSERRQHSREVINHEFESVRDFLYEYALNISVGGVFIRTEEVFPLDTEVDLKFTILAEEIVLIEGRGRVVRLQEGANIGMGVVFIQLTEASKVALTKLFVKDVS